MQHSIKYSEKILKKTHYYDYTNTVIITIELKNG